MGMVSYPRSRATSSMQSISRVRSRRQEGTLQRPSPTGVELQRPQPAIDLLVRRPSTPRTAETRAGPHHHLRRLARRRIDVERARAAAGRRRAARSAPRSGSPRAPPSARPCRARSGATPRCAARAGARCGGCRAGSNIALSSRTRVVASPTSLVCAAHHAGQGDRLLGIGDHQVVGAELALLAVERGQRLALARAAHHDAAAGELLQIESVQRVAQLEQGQVGGVDDVADGAHAAGAQALLHASGDGPIFTPSITRATYRGQRCASSIVDARRERPLAGGLGLRDPHRRRR